MTVMEISIVITWSCTRIPISHYRPTAQLMKYRD